MNAPFILRTAAGELRLSVHAGPEGVMIRSELRTGLGAFKHLSVVPVHDARLFAGDLASAATTAEMMAGSAAG